MTQHDFEWADQLFPQFRTDMNNALIALSTRQAGDGAPPLVAAARPNRVYVDTARKQVLARDNADTTDFIWDSWAQNRVRVISVDETLVAEDVGRLIIGNKATLFAVYLPQAVGNFAASWHTEIFNFGAGNLHVRPVACTLNGVTEIILEQYQGLKAFSLDGNYWAALTGRGNVTKTQMDAAIAATLVPTGAITAYAGWGAPPAGWVRLLGGTIGNAVSGANERAHADTWPLYALIWGHYGQAQAPVNGGRGAAADQDFNANKWITLFDVRGRTVFSVDHGANRLTGPYPGGLQGQTPGAVGGEQIHVLTIPEMPYHEHPPPPGVLNNFIGDAAAGPTGILSPGSVTRAWHTTGGAGGSGPHNTVPPGIALGCYIAKL